MGNLYNLILSSPYFFVINTKDITAKKINKYVNNSVYDPKAIGFLMR